MELLATYDLTSENNNFNKSSSYSNAKYISTDQVEMKETENIQAIRLSIYPKTFLVFLALFSLHLNGFFKMVFILA